MASLTASTPFADLLPLSVDGAELSEITFDTITWLAPFIDQDEAVSDALESQIGAALPAPNRSTGTAGKRAIWAGPRQALVLGPTLTPISGAAMVDQSSAWAACAIDGPQAAAVLARLVPIDLRDDRFAVGHVARTLLCHMNCVLTRTQTARYELMVFRSMAGTASHELGRAMRMIAARQAR